MSAALPVVSLLACGALGFVLWELLAPSTTKPIATHVALVALSLAFALGPHILPLFTVGGEVHPPARLEYVAGGCFLGLLGITLLKEEMLRPQSSSNVALTHALPLMAACGAILALWSPNLVGLAVGIGLYAVARPAAWRGERYTGRALLGLLSALLGVALLHNETATFDMAALGRFLWRHGEPLPFSLYVGLGAVLGGIALCTGLVSALGTFDEGGHSPVSHLLALLVFLRLGLHLGALAWECFWICLFFSLVCLVYGWAMVLSQTLHDPLRRIWGLLAAQRGLLLLALAFVFRGQDLTLLVTVIVAYALVQGVVRLGLRWLLASGDVALAGLLFRAVIEMPLLGVPLCFGFLSLIGLPPTLGFIVRAELVRLGWAGGLTWLAPCVVAMSIFSLWGLAPLVIPSSQQERAFIDSPPPWPLRITLVLAAAALVALGLFPLPLVRLASWVVGG